MMRKLDFLLFILLSIFCFCGVVVGLSRIESDSTIVEDNSLLPPYLYSRDHAVAQNGYVFVSKKGYYYYEVKNPTDFEYMSKVDADRCGFVMGPHPLVGE